MSGRAWVRAVLVSLAVSAAFTAYNIRYPGYDPDQHIFGAMLLKDNAPELFAKDFCFSDPRAYEYYIPWYRSLAHVFVGRSEGVALLRRYNLMLLPTAFFFVLGFYALFYHLTRCEAASWAAALGAVMSRAGLSVNAFGIGLSQSMYAYKLFFAAVPWLFYLLIRFEFSRMSVAAAFFLLGLASNFHPIMGMGLAAILAVTLGWMKRKKGRRDVVLGLILFSAGISHFLYVFFLAMPQAPNTLTADEFWTTFSRAWGYFPIGLKGIRNFLFCSLPLIVFSCWVWRRRSEESANAGANMFFGIFTLATVGVTFIEAGALQAQSLLMNRPPLISLEPLRSTVFLYVPLLAWTAIFLAAVRKETRYLFVLAVLLLFAQKEFPFRQLIREAMLEGGIYSNKRTEIWARERTRWADLLELSAWVRRNTPIDAVFFHPHYDFRFHAQRGIVVGYKDGGFMTRIGGAEQVRAWLTRTRIVKAAIDSKDPVRIRETAAALGCGYVVVREGFGMTDPGVAPVFENKSYRLYRVTETPSPAGPDR